MRGDCLGLFEALFGRFAQPKQVQAQPLETFRALTGYRPTFTSWDGQIYESDLCRAAIDALARHSAKLTVSVHGTALPKLRTRLRSEPNPFMTWSQFLYRTRTILEVQNTCFIVPVYAEDGSLAGYFPAVPSTCEVVGDAKTGEVFLKYRFVGGQTAALPFDDCGVLTRRQYKDDFFGESNAALQSTMDLIGMQKQGIAEGIRNSATFRFMAKVGNFTKPDDLSRERQRFNAENLRGESGGILLFPNTYTDIHQINQQAYAVQADQMQLIQTNVFNYFGVNLDVLQNKTYGDAWTAFYEGAIEYFAVQLSDVLTGMTFTGRERSTGNGVFVSSNRLQYMSNADKLSVSAQMADRGLMTRNEIREIWNLPPLPDEIGGQLPIRGEYYNLGDERPGVQNQEVTSDADGQGA